MEREEEEDNRGTRITRIRITGDELERGEESKYYCVVVMRMMKYEQWIFIGKVFAFSSRAGGDGEMLRI